MPRLTLLEKFFIIVVTFFAVTGVYTVRRFFVSVFYPPDEEIEG